MAIEDPPPTADLIQLCEHFAALWTDRAQGHVDMLAGLSASPQQNVPAHHEDLVARHKFCHAQAVAQGQMWRARLDYERTLIQIRNTVDTPPA